jgi:hypothetical protein
VAKVENRNGSIGQYEESAKRTQLSTWLASAKAYSQCSNPSFRTAAVAAAHLQMLGLPRQLMFVKAASSMTISG